MQKTMEVMQKSAHKLSLLMDELLLFRKSEGGTLTLHLQEICVNDLVEGVCMLYEHEASAKNISLQYPKNTKEVYAVLDIDKLGKVLNNLLTNALKFTPQNGTITVGFKKDIKGLSISVTDDGKGINKKEIEQIFQRFFQADADKQKGFGIGLALSKRIVDAHNGKLVVDSKPNQGSTFSIQIPILEANLTAEQSIKKIEEKDLITFKKISPSHILNKNELNGTILIVEDDEEIRQYIASIFELQFTVIAKENGAEGHAWAQTNLPDIIITDYQMPIMDGITMCKKLKSELLTSHIPIVMLSAFNEVEDQLKGFTVGADDYIGKPFDKEILYHKIINILHSRKKLIDSYQKGKQFDLVQLELQDQRFIKQINKVIKAELRNEKLDVTLLSQQMNMSRTTLNNKLKSMLSITPAEYIKKEKLKEGHRMLTEEGCNVTEAAYAIGYSYAYFNTVFKKEYGISPGKV